MVAIPETNQKRLMRYKRDRTVTQHRDMLGAYTATCVPDDISLEDAVKMDDVLRGYAHFCPNCNAYVNHGFYGRVCEECGHGADETTPEWLRGGLKSEEETKATLPPPDGQIIEQWVEDGEEWRIVVRPISNDNIELVVEVWMYGTEHLGTDYNTPWHWGRCWINGFGNKQAIDIKAENASELREAIECCRRFVSTRGKNKGE